MAGQSMSSEVLIVIVATLIDSFEGTTSSKPFVSSIEQIVFKGKGIRFAYYKGNPIWALSTTSVADGVYDSSVA